MSPGIGAPELLVVLVLALVVVGPQQLPVLMRRVGRVMGQARSMAREFQHSFEEIGRETELAELRKEIEALKSANPIEEIRGEVDKAALETRNDEIRNLKIAKAKQADGPLFERKPDPDAAPGEDDNDTAGRSPAKPAARDSD